MINTLANVISRFPGAANRARCTAHIVNLVTKIILRQFDTTHPRKKTKGPNTDNDNDNENAIVDDGDDMAGIAEELNREEQEVADDEDNDMSGNIAADLEEIEEAMEVEISEVAKKVKPIQRVLFKVRHFIILTNITY
jgi:hypothetical protein